MSSYIHFTEEQKQRAAAVDLEEFLRCRGEKLLSSGREKRLASDHSVTVRGNEWYDHAEERGGHAVSFVQRFYSLSYPDAVTMLLGGELGTAYPSAGERTEEPVKPFALPPANKDMRRVFAYLIKHRGIAKDVVAHFAKAGLLYEDAEYHNAVFVGTDAEGVPRHAHKRSANSYLRYLCANFLAGIPSSTVLCDSSEMVQCPTKSRLEGLFTTFICPGGSQFVFTHPNYAFLSSG